MTGSRFQMADIGDKPISRRAALASGAIFIGREAFDLAARGALPKGDPLALAEAAGIAAAKKTCDLLPLCHPLSLDHVAVRCLLAPESLSIRVLAEVRAEAKTGVEMEALTAVCHALLCIYDMIKPVNPALTISDIRLCRKEGGKRGVWTHPLWQGDADVHRERRS